MRTKLRSAAAALRRRAVGPLRSYRQGRLRRELDEQSTKDYWRRRQESRRRRFWLVELRHDLGLRLASAREQTGILVSAVKPLLQGSALGGLALLAILGTEAGLAQWVASSLIPSGEGRPPLGAFPTLAAQVSASLLGFYLASVGIVLGTSYHDAPSGLRSLVLRNPRTQLQLKAIGAAIAIGLAIVVLQSLGYPYGYVTVLTHGALVLLGGWAFAQLAFGAFDLFDPVALAGEPLAALRRASKRIGSRGLAGDDAVLRAAAQEADRALLVLAQLIEWRSRRESESPDQLALLVDLLLREVQSYVERKHLLAPTSAWFLPEPTYPRWVETGYSATSIALATSTPLQPTMEPANDWLERRSAKLVGGALQACVIADAQEPAIAITRAVARTAQALARSSRFDDALVLSGVVRDRCRASGVENDTAFAVAAEPPVIMTSMLLGWREALGSWRDEIDAAVAATRWDQPNAGSVAIRGPAHVRTAAERLLREVQAELEIEGRRVTPDSHFEFVLAGEFFSVLRGFTEEFPEHLAEYFAGPAAAGSSPALEAMIGTQALQTLAKADLVLHAIPRVVDDLSALRGGRDPLPTEELGDLAETIQTMRSAVLERVANAVTQLQPEQSTSGPDLFGEAWFNLVHHAAEAIASGNVDLVDRVFSQILTGTYTLQDYVVSTYRPPTYQITRAHLDPMIDTLELSGLAIAYEALRGDGSAADVRQAWTAHIEASGRTEGSAKQILDLLDMATAGSALTPQSVARGEWSRRLARRIFEEGYARPRYFSLDDPPPWNAPPLIKMLGVDESMPRLRLDPRVIFGAEVLGPLSGETEDALRSRPGLKRYFEARDRRGAPEKTEGRGGDTATPSQGEAP